jgi:glutaredoxin
MKIEIVSLNGCYWCSRAVQLVERSGLNVATYRLMDKSSPQYAEEKGRLFERIRDEAIARDQDPADEPFSQKTFPFIWVNGRFVGGFNGLSCELVGSSIIVN